MNTFANLPKPIQQLIISHLIRNDFPAAKQIFDKWMQLQNSKNFSLLEEKNPNNGAHSSQEKT